MESKYRIAKRADLPVVLSSMGQELRSERGNDYRIPGNGGLTIFIDRNGSWRFYRFSDKSTGDGVDLLKLLGYSEDQALDALTGGNIPVLQTSLAEKKEAALQGKPFDRQTANRIMKYAQDDLKDAGKHLFDWLKIDRGLSDESIKRFRLGFNRQFNNLVIPCYNEGKLVRLRFRNCDTGSKLLYPGSDGKAFFNVPDQIKDTVIVVESELDCIYLDQILGNQTCISSGTAGNLPEGSLKNRLKDSRRLIICLDNDEAGKMATDQWLKDFPNAFEMPVPKPYKDIGDSWNKIDLKSYFTSLKASCWRCKYFIFGNPDHPNLCHKTGYPKPLQVDVDYGCRRFEQDTGR